jgi:hypothetical protein
MSPPHAQFIDLSIRDPGRQAATPPSGSMEIAAKVPDASTALYGRTAHALRLHALPHPVAIDSESERWFSFLDTLKARAAAGSVTSAQQTALLAIWERALLRQPLLRRPAVGVSPDGLIQASWSFQEVPGRVFTLEIHRDGTLDWFYRDPAAGIVRGTDDEATTELPDEALQFLADGFGTSGTRIR